MKATIPCSTLTVYISVFWVGCEGYIPCSTHSVYISVFWGGREGYDTLLNSNCLYFIILGRSWKLPYPAQLTLFIFQYFGEVMKATTPCSSLTVYISVFLGGREGYHTLLNSLCLYFSILGRAWRLPYPAQLCLYFNILGRAWRLWYPAQLCYISVFWGGLEGYHTRLNSNCLYFSILGRAWRLPYLTQHWPQRRINPHGQLFQNGTW